MFSYYDCTLSYTVLLDTFRPHGGVVESDVLLPLHSTNTQLHQQWESIALCITIITLSRGLVVMWLQSLFARCFEGSHLYGFPTSATQFRVLRVVLKVVTVHSEAVNVCERKRRKREYWQVILHLHVLCRGCCVHENQSGVTLMSKTMCTKHLSSFLVNEALNNERWWNEGMLMKGTMQQLEEWSSSPETSEKCVQECLKRC